ncbi:MAG: hypothetical protein ACRDPC_20970 [Solirubrobacteraceae bacterium]
MLLLRRARPEAASEPADQAELSHTLVPLTGTMARAWPVHARRCLHRLPERLRWAAPLLDPDQPSDLDCAHEQARELLLWLHHLPSHEHPIVGCHPHRPA